MGGIGRRDFRGAEPSPTERLFQVSVNALLSFPAVH